MRSRLAPLSSGQSTPALSPFTPNLALTSLVCRVPTVPRSAVLNLNIFFFKYKEIGE